MLLAILAFFPLALLEGAKEYSQDYSCCILIKLHDQVFKAGGIQQHT
jgi:hypothetical protein